MTSADRVSLRAILLEEVIDEMTALEGAMLDEFLADAGFDPAGLLLDFNRSFEGSDLSPGRLKFEAAKAALRNRRPDAEVVHLDPARKREVFNAIKRRMAVTNDMTIAARSQKIDSETDLDRFLEACIGLGIIDQNGNMKE